MLIKLLIRCGVKEVSLAGFDGFSEKAEENYYDSELRLHMNEEDIMEKQERFKRQLEDMSKDIQSEFLTSSIYEVK